MVDHITPCTYHFVQKSTVQQRGGEVPTEQALTLFVNAQELVTLMCTPVHTEALALGFLLNEGLIQTQEDVRLVTQCGSGSCIDVWLAYNLPPGVPQRRIITSGCAGGVTFEKLTAAYPPLETDNVVDAAQLRHLMGALNAGAVMHQRVGGVHTSGLGQDGALLFIIEDIGRHNTLDKLHGLAFLKGIDTNDAVLLTTGRISSEMLNKARHMGVPVVVSRTSPTSLSVQMARAWGITLVGYLRRDRMTVYTHPQRVLDLQKEHIP